MPLRFSLLPHGGEAYAQMLQLRVEVLLKPINIEASYINTAAEKTDFLIGAFDDNTLIGCCVLSPRENGRIQLRRMAVAIHWQTKGIGAALVHFAEQVATENGFDTMLLHARSPVVGFYQKSGYSIVGAPFTEVGILHYRMEKPLKNQ